MQQLFLIGRCWHVIWRIQLETRAGHHQRKAKDRKGDRHTDNKGRAKAQSAKHALEGSVRQTEAQKKKMTAPFHEQAKRS